MDLMRKIPGDVHRKLMAAELLELKSAGGFVARVFSFGGPDLDGDVQVPGSVENIGDEVIVSSWGHNAMTTTPPVGRATLSEDSTGLLATGKLFDTEPGRHALAVLRSGPTEWSYGYKVTQRDGAKILRQRVSEVSPVLRGAGLATGTLRVGDVETSSAGMSDADRKLVADLKRRMAVADAAERAEVLDVLDHTERTLRRLRGQR